MTLSYINSLLFSSLLHGRSPLFFTADHLSSLRPITIFNTPLLMSLVLGVGFRLEGLGIRVFHTPLLMSLDIGLLA